MCTKTFSIVLFRIEISETTQALIEGGLAKWSGYTHIMGNYTALMMNDLYSFQHGKSSKHDVEQSKQVDNEYAKHHSIHINFKMPKTKTNQPTFVVVVTITHL